MKRRMNRTIICLQLAPLRLVVAQETHDSAPSSSAFAAAAPVDDSAPGLAKVEPKPFPFKLKAGGQ